MTTDKQLLEQALEALEKWTWIDTPPQEVRESITAIRARLEQPEERYTYGTPLLDAFTKPAPVQEPVTQEPFGYFQYDIRLDAWVQNRINNKGVAFYTKEQK